MLPEASVARASTRWGPSPRRRKAASAAQACQAAPSTRQEKVLPGSLLLRRTVASVDRVVPAGPPFSTVSGAVASAAVTSTLSTALPPWLLLTVSVAT